MNGQEPVRTLVWYWGTGGAGIRFTARVAESIAQQHGPERVALALHEENAWVERSRERGHPVRCVRGANGHSAILGIALQAPSRWWALRSQINRFKPDVVVIPMTFALAWPHCLLARRLNIPLIFVAHDDRPHIGDYRPAFQSLVQTVLLQQASQTVAVSDYVRQKISASGKLQGRPPCELIPLAAHDVAYRSTPKPAPLGEVSFLFLGRLLKYKGLLMLADALEPFRNRPGWRLTIAGCGPEADNVWARFRQFSQVDLSRLRVLDEAEVDALLQEHDVLVCPYLEASQSGVISEGLYYGLPSLATPVGALPEQIGLGQAGWIAPSTTAEGLRQTLGALLDDPAAIGRASAHALEIVAPPRTRAWGDLVEAVARRG